ncbi:hypothetical protein TNCV_1478031 [Trichonephila clavipes]|nr:hypothetical protein TNCV_1478031 [Trichonephila clavipes]
MWSMVAQRLIQITPPAASPDQLWQRVEATLSAVPQEHIQIEMNTFEDSPRQDKIICSMQTLPRSSTDAQSHLGMPNRRNKVMGIDSLWELQQP